MTTPGKLNELNDAEEPAGVWEWVRGDTEDGRRGCATVGRPAPGFPLSRE